MGPPHDFLEVLDVHVRVDLRGPQAGVSEDRLDVTQVRVVSSPSVSRASAIGFTRSFSPASLRVWRSQMGGAYVCGPQASGVTEIRCVGVQ